MGINHEATSHRDMYRKLLIDGASHACLLIERQYGLDGYPPEIVMVGLNAAARGEDQHAAVDAYMEHEE